MDEQEVLGGAGQLIRTPESGNTADPAAGDDLLEAQAKLPLASNDEMRAYMYPELATPEGHRRQQRHGLGHRGL